jgi:hypothetical protein
MEGIGNTESREAFITRRIEEVAAMEGMEKEDLLSDMMTFVEIVREDKDAMPYFEELADKIGVSVEEIIEYSAKL